MKKYISILLAAVVATGMQSFAAELSVTQKGTDITIGITQAAEDTQVLIKVASPEGEVNFLDDNYTNGSGEYSVTYDIGDGGGIFDVNASVGGVLMESKRFIVRTAEVENILVNALKQQASSATPDAAALQQKIEEYWLALEVDETLYNSLGDKDNVFVKMAGDKANGRAEDFGDFVNAFYKAVVLEKYKELTNKNDICAILKTSPYKEAFGENGSFFAARLDDITAEAMPYITSDMAADYVSADTFIEAAELSLLKSAISKSSLWTGVRAVTENYKDKLGITGSISNDEYKAITGKTYNSYADIKTALTSSGGGSVGGGISGGSVGGGSKKSGGGFIATPVNPPLQTAETEVKSGKSVFADMSDFKWAEEAVSHIYSLGIVNGDGDGNFSPRRGVSRAEAAKMLVLLMKKDVSNPPEYIPFEDVEKTSWSYPYIAAAYTNKVINGRSANYFDANGGITRQEMAVMAWNAMKAMGFTDKGREQFEDADEIAVWAKDAVEILGNYGIVNGRNDGEGFSFAPTENINRAEAAMIIYNIATRLP